MQQVSQVFTINLVSDGEQLPFSLMMLAFLILIFVSELLVELVRYYSGNTLYHL
jgi:hypothetical protein